MRCWLLHEGMRHCASGRHHARDGQSHLPEACCHGLAGTKQVPRLPSPRLHPVRTQGGSERTALKVHVLWLRGSETCMESGLATTIDLWPGSTVLMGPWGRPHWLPIIAECAWRRHRGGGIWPSPKGSTSVLATSPASNLIMLMDGWACVACQGKASLRNARWLESRHVGGHSKIIQNPL